MCRITRMARESWSVGQFRSDHRTFVAIQGLYFMTTKGKGEQAEQIQRNILKLWRNDKKNFDSPTYQRVIREWIEEALEGKERHIVGLGDLINPNLLEKK